MQVFMVGGAVRDRLLGLPVKDRDWVVVGATPDEMLARGFRPVGKDFPVFLHPDTHEEYALARTERKTGRGYKGFAFDAAPDVTLQDDLLRRDLTINAIACDAEGRLIDPHGGAADIERRVFRHVSAAFGEDPVRILRVARFAARFVDFSIAPETLALMCNMVEQGEVDHLVTERVWQELARGLMEATPSRMIQTLRACGALARILPELDRLFGVPVPQASRHQRETDTGVRLLAVIDHAALTAQTLEVRWACLLHALGNDDTAQPMPPQHEHEARSARQARAISERLKAPAECRDLAEMVAREHGLINQTRPPCPTTMVKLFERCDAFRRPQRFELMLDACTCLFHGCAASAAPPRLATDLWRSARTAAAAIDAGALARACIDKRLIPARLHDARVAAVGIHIAEFQRKQARPID